MNPYREPSKPKSRRLREYFIDRKRWLNITPLTAVLAAMLIAGIAIAATPALRVNGIKIGPNDFTAYVTAYGAKCDGATDDAAAINSAIAAAAGKGPVIFPPGVCVYNSTLTLVDGTKLWGYGFQYNTETGTVLKRGANVVGISAVGTSILSAGTHLQQIEIKNLYLDGGNFASDLVQFKYVSNALIERNYFFNSAGRHIFFGEVFDTRLNNNQLEWGGTADGITPMVEFTSNGVTTYQCSNQIHLMENRFESFRGTALRVTGACTNRLFFIADKFESQGISNQPALDFTGVTDIDLNGVDVVENGTAANTIAELVNMNTVVGFRGRMWLTHASGGAGLTQYINMTSCTKGDLDVQIDDTNYSAITNPTIVKQTTCDFVSVRGYPMDAGGVWTKDMTDQAYTLPGLLQQYGVSPYLKQIDRTLNGAMFLGRIVNNGSGGTLWKIIGLKNDNTTEQTALQIDANTGQVTFPVNAVSSNSLYVGAGASLDTVAAGSLFVGNASATSVTIAKAGVTTTVAGPLQSTGTTFASLGTPGNGTLIYCSDCTVANPCAGAGTGAFAKRLNGAWVCN